MRFSSVDSPALHYTEEMDLLLNAGEKNWINSVWRWDSSRNTLEKKKKYGAGLESINLDVWKRKSSVVKLTFVLK